ncbi:alkaline phosphatase [Streptococcus uberis]
MSPKKKSLKSLGMLLLASSLVLGACSQESALKIDTDAANSSKKAEKTANGKSVQMYDSKRPKTEDYSKVNDHQAKYVFLFIGDGMGVTPVTAAENYLGYAKTNKGEVYPTRMNFTEMPVIGLKSQYDCHSFIPDSASTATAFASGIKTQTNTVGLSGDFEKSSDSVAEKAKRAGKSVGILTTVTLNHATPAAFYANEESRSSYYDIGLQMADSNFDFFAGGSLKDRTGKENDQKDLYDVMKEKGYHVVETKAEAEKVDAKAKKTYIVSEELQDDPEGFFMMAESGKIDWAEHANDGATTVNEVIGFQKSIQTAMDFYNEHPDETLIVVTADHATGGFTIGNESTGYETYFDQLTKQKGSQIEFDKIVTKALEENPDMTFEAFAPKIEDFFGLKLDKNAPSEKISVEQEEDYLKKQAENRSLCSQEEYKALEEAFEESKKAPEQQNTNYGEYIPVSITATRILDKKAGLAWSTTDHSGEKVPVYAMGSGAIMFDGEYDDTDVAVRLGEAMGFNGKDSKPKEQVEKKAKKPSGVGLEAPKEK